MVTCRLGSFDLRTIGSNGKATAALAEGKRRLENGAERRAKAAVQAAMDIVKAKARAPPPGAAGTPPPPLHRHSMPESPARAPPCQSPPRARIGGSTPSGLPGATGTTPTGATRKTRSYAPLLTAHREAAKVNRWTIIAQHVPGRDGPQCSWRWNQVIDPNIDHSEWRDEEFDRLKTLVEQMGTKWEAVAKALSQGRSLRRSGNTCKNTFNMRSKPKRAQAERRGGQEEAGRGGVGGVKSEVLALLLTLNYSPDPDPNPNPNPNPNLNPNPNPNPDPSPNPHPSQLGNRACPSRSAALLARRQAGRVAP